MVRASSGLIPKIANSVQVMKAPQHKKLAVRYVQHPGNAILQAQAHRN